MTSCAPCCNYTTLVTPLLNNAHHTLHISFPFAELYVHISDIWNTSLAAWIQNWAVLQEPQTQTLFFLCPHGHSFVKSKLFFRFLNSSFLVPLRGFPLTPCCSPFPHFHYFSNLFVTLDHLQCFFNLGLIVTPYHHVSIVLNLSIFYFLYLSSDDFCQYMLFTPPPLNLSATFNDNTLL